VSGSTIPAFRVCLRSRCLANGLYVLLSRKRVLARYFPAFRSHVTIVTVFSEPTSDKEVAGQWLHCVREGGGGSLFI
jgi:hypothetical protein